MRQIWTPEEIELLKKVSKKSKSILEIWRNYFPYRSVNSVKWKCLDLGITPSGSNHIYRNPKDQILGVLRNSTYPIEVNDLLLSVNNIVEKKIDLLQLKREIKELIREGYDIKEIPSGDQIFYTLVRYAERDSKAYYRILGKIKLPFICSSDWHIGSVGYSPLLFKELLKDVEEFSVRDLVMAGDLLQGRGVHRRELMDLLIPDIQGQIDHLVDLLHCFPKNTRFHMTIGGHEEAIKGKVSVGLDPLRVVAQRVKNANYYGAVAKLQVEKDWDLVMMHGSGGTSYARSYKADKLWDALTEKPNFLVIGHFHVLSVFSKGRQYYIIQSGTLQRENSYLIWKGLTPELGWVVIQDFDGETCKYVIRQPKIY